MTNMAYGNEALDCRAHADAGALQSHPTRDAELGGGLTIRRALPHRQRRLVGPWCFLDHFGPRTFPSDSRLMRVGPHPHIGLQTVTWLFEGEILHRDSLGHEQLIRPGQLNLMTAGRGIAHSEETPAQHSGRLHGLQFWVALPADEADCEPDFVHHAELPLMERDGLRLRVFAGTLEGERPPARHHSPIAGADLELVDTGSRELALEPEYEHALLVVEGGCRLDGVPLEPGRLYYLGPGRDRLRLENTAPARLGLFGGTPFGESLILWWNFVARTPAEIQTARADWQARAARFGEVRGYDGPRLEAPELAARLRAG